LLPVLFQPFTRGTADVVSPHGLGLGLFVVNEIVKAHGGTIHVESTAAAGTKFELHLPRAQEGSHPGPEEPHAAQESPPSA
jgi:signal transduction histidine kinase